MLFILKIANYKADISILNTAIILVECANVYFKSIKMVKNLNFYFSQKNYNFFEEEKTKFSRQFVGSLRLFSGQFYIPCCCSYLPSIYAA